MGWKWDWWVHELELLKPRMAPLYFMHCGLRVGFQTFNAVKGSTKTSLNASNATIRYWQNREIHPKYIKFKALLCLQETAETTVSWNETSQRQSHWKAGPNLGVEENQKGSKLYLFQTQKRIVCPFWEASGKCYNQARFVRREQSGMFVVYCWKICIIPIGLWFDFLVTLFLV